LSEMYDGRCEPRDIPDEEGLRTVCEELNMSPISDRVVIYHQRFSEKEKRALEQGLKHFLTIKIDEFLAFKTEHTVGRWLLMPRHRFQVRTRNILLVIHRTDLHFVFQTILEKCMCEPGNAWSSSEESVLKTVLQMRSSEDTALRLPQPISGIGRRSTIVLPPRGHRNGILRTSGSVLKISSSVKPNMELFLEEILTRMKFMAKQDDLSEAFLVDATATYDSAIAASWLSGTIEAFTQLMNWVIDGTMPVNYQHRSIGITLLMAATIHGRTDIVECLVSHGADPTMKVREVSSSDIACFISLLITYSFFRLKSKGLTLFDMASEFALPEMAELLQTCSEAFSGEEAKRKGILATPMVESAVSYDDVSCAVENADDRLCLEPIDLPAYKARGKMPPGAALPALFYHVMLVGEDFHEFLEHKIGRKIPIGRKRKKIPRTDSDPNLGEFIELQERILLI